MLEFANPTDSLLIVDFHVLPSQLSFHHRHVELLPYSRHFLSYTVLPDSSRWGAVNYSLVPTVNGVARDSIVFSGVAIPDFSDLSSEEVNSSSYVEAVYKQVGFGPVSQSGSASFTVRIENKSTKPVRILNISSDEPSVSFPPYQDVLEGKSILRLQARLNPGSIAPGAHSFNVYIVLDSPLSPLVTMNVSGYIVSE